MAIDVSLEEHVGAESLLATVDNALEGFVVTVVGHDVLFKPRP